jgi:hypothetical protein
VFWFCNEIDFLIIIAYKIQDLNIDACHPYIKFLFEDKILYQIINEWKVFSNCTKVTKIIFSITKY